MLQKVYLFVFPNDGTVLLDLRFRLIELPSAHLLQLQNTKTLNGRKHETEFIAQDFEGRRLSQLNARSFWPSPALNTTSDQEHESVKDAPLRPTRQETLGGRRGRQVFLLPQRNSYYTEEHTHPVNTERLLTF